MRGKEVIILFLCVAALASCRKEEYRRSHTIRFNVVAADTKSVAMTTTGLKAEGRFVVDVFVDDPWNDYDTYPDDKPDTPRYGNSESDRHYVKSTGLYNVKYGSADWYIEDASGKETYKWIGNDVMRFWCYWPDNASVDAAAEGIRAITLPSAADKASSIGFTYTLPTEFTPADPSAPMDTPAHDAENQKDILFAYAQRNYQKNEDDGINIKFNHPLSEVKFCVSPDDGTYDVNLTIKRITIKNVKNSGSCTFNGMGIIADESMFAWTDLTGNKAYSQDYNVSFATSLTTPPSGWTVSEFGSTTPKKHAVSCNTAFMMIPQTVPTGAEIEVVFGNTGTGEDITKTHTIADDTWKPGYYYNYKINATAVGRSISMIVILDEWGNFEDKLIVS